MHAPIIVIDPASPIPPYEQIGAAIRRLAATKRINPGMLLPSVRQLASDLGVAPSTVARAYTELERDGWVTTLPRRGIIVAERDTATVGRDRAAHLDTAVATLLQTAYQLGFDGEDVIAVIRRQMAP